MDKKSSCVCWVIIALLSVSMSGCASLQKKFTRKKEPRTVQPVIYTEKEYVKPYSNKYYYQTHHSQWRTWHSELLKSLGGNVKRERRSISEAIGQLDQMLKYIHEPHREELASEIQNMKQIEARLSVLPGHGREVNLKRKIEKSYRNINSRFSYSAMKDHLVPDETEF